MPLGLVEAYLRTVMALLTLRRIPSISTPPDESFQRRGRLQKRESFALVKGAVHLLEEGDKDDAEDETASSPTFPAKESDAASEARRRQLHAMVEQLRPEDTMKLAVQLESVSAVRVRYLMIVSTLASKQESVLLGMDFPNSESDQCTIGLVLPVWSDTQVYLDGDGGFSITSTEEMRTFKPVSMQTMWSVLQALHGCCERAVKAGMIPGSGLEWARHYQQHVESDRSCLNEWEVLNELESVRKDSEGYSSADRLSKEVLIKKHLRDIMNHADLGNLTSRMVLDNLTSRLDFDLKPYKKYIDNEILVTLAQMDRPSKIFDYLYLGSEWNAANFEELQKNNVGYILNVTREIDNFFPESFAYMNIRVYDVEASDLLPHWKDTYSFIDAARKSGKAVLVHCKMGISRSGSTVVAYAMKKQHWPLDVALAYVKDRRSVVKPNDGFMKQLQLYNGILNASQQRHSALWRRKSRDQKSVRKDDGPVDQQPVDEVDRGESEEEDEEEEEEEEESSEELEESDEEEVFEEPRSQPDCIEVPEKTEPPAADPAVKAASSVDRSGRMNLLSLMQSISELEDVQQLPVSPLRSPRQQRRSRGLVHQRACTDVSPGPPRLPDPSPNES